MTSRSGGRSSIALIAPVSDCVLEISNRQHRFGRHARGKPQRRDQAGRIGAAGAGNIERGAIVRRGADERQSQRDIDGIVKANVLTGISA